MGGAQAKGTSFFPPLGEPYCFCLQTWGGLSTHGVAGFAGYNSGSAFSAQLFQGGDMFSPAADGAPPALGGEFSSGARECAAVGSAPSPTPEAPTVRVSDPRCLSSSSMSFKFFCSSLCCLLASQGRMWCVGLNVRK